MNIAAACRRSSENALPGRNWHPKRAAGCRITAATIKKKYWKYGRNAEKRNGAGSAFIHKASRNICFCHRADISTLCRKQNRYNNNNISSKKEQYNSFLISGPVHWKMSHTIPFPFRSFRFFNCGRPPYASRNASIPLDSGSMPAQKESRRFKLQISGIPLSTLLSNCAYR